MNCEKVLKSKSVVTTCGNTNVLFGNVGETLKNGTVLRVVICQTIPSANPFGMVSFTMNGVTFPLLTKCANTVRNDQIRSRRVYAVAVGAEKPTLNLLTCIPKSGVTFAEYPQTV